MKPQASQVTEVRRRSSFEVTTKDGVRISFDLYRQADRRTVVIICPGFFQSKETAIFRRLASDLSKSRDVLCMDFRGHGRSGGLYTFSAKEELDLEAVLQWARSRYSEIHLVGFSLGGAVAINTLHRNFHGVQSLVVVSSPSAFEQIEFRIWHPKVIYGGLRTWDSRMGCRPGNPLLKKKRPIESIQRLSPLPVFLIHGTQDSIVGHTHSERLHKAAREPKRLELIEKGGHAEELYRRNPGRFLRLVEDWLRLMKSEPTRTGEHDAVRKVR